jgi:predicted small lipoprotein YifL
MHSATLRITLLLLLAAAGCGQKGPLYLPDKTRAPVPASSSATPAPAQPAPASPAAPAVPPAPAAPAARPDAGSSHG